MTTRLKLTASVPHSSLIVELETVNSEGVAYGKPVQLRDGEEHEYYLHKEHSLRIREVPVAQVTDLKSGMPKVMA